MSKQKLLLSEVLKIQETVVKLIEETENSICIHNSTEKKVDGLFDHLLKLEDQLIIIKEAIQTANKSKGSDRKTNNYWIYTLSNHNRRRVFYNTLNPSKGDEKAQITFDKVRSLRKLLAGQIEVARNKLTAFNNSKKIKVDLDDSLNLI